MKILIIILNDVFPNQIKEIGFIIIIIGCIHENQWHQTPTPNHTNLQIPG